VATVNRILDRTHNEVILIKKPVVMLRWRRILRVLWTEKITNLSVLEDVKPKRSLEATILRLKLTLFR
jgi:hypothetical protein